MATPGLFAQNADAHIVLEILDHVLDRVRKATVGNHRYAACKREHDDQQHDRRHDEPERILGDSVHQIANHGDRAKARYEVIDLSRQLIERFQGFTFLLFARTHVRARNYFRLPLVMQYTARSVQQTKKPTSSPTKHARTRFCENK